MRKKRRTAIISLAAFLSSSMAEHSAVNRRVVSSSLTWGATSPRTSNRSRRHFSFWRKRHRSPSPLRLLSANDHACCGCSVVNVLATPPRRYQSLAGKSVINRRTKEKRPSSDGRFSFFCTLAYSPRFTAAAETCAKPSARCAGCSEAEARVKQGEKRTVRGFRPCFTMGRVVSSSQTSGAN